MAAANAFWPVFCTPRARPAQDDPACSATAVKASPLVLTERTAAASSAATDHGDRLTAATASKPMISAVPRTRRHAAGPGRGARVDR